MGRRLNASPLPDFVRARLVEGVFILSLTLALYLLIALVSYHAGDPAWNTLNSATQIRNAGGRVGAWFADVLLTLFGTLAYSFPFFLAYGAYLLLRDNRVNPIDKRILAVRLVGMSLVLSAACGLASIQFSTYAFSLPFSSGGLLGYGVASGLSAAFNASGGVLFLVAWGLIGITLFTGLSWLQLLKTLPSFSKNIWIFCRQSLRAWQARKPKIIKPRVEPQIHIPKAKPKTAPRKKVAKLTQSELFANPPEGTVPSLHLLDPTINNPSQGFSEKALAELSAVLEQQLEHFGVEVKVVAVHPGPVITRFELDLAPGVKVSKISGLAKDLARSLSVTSVRVVDVIPGKPYVGIELPNEKRVVVRLSEVLNSKTFSETKSQLSLALGVDIAGNPAIVDLAKMPHLLVAGTTGSGKSVGLNAMLLSLLYKLTPRELRLIMIDPKMLELSVYDGIPHLLTPVVTDMKEASNALRWCVAEMERRYQLMATLGVRNVGGFNQKILKQKIPDPLWTGEDEADRPMLEHLPFVVVVIDELADMMMVVGKKVEQLIARIAQKARAAGIHLILATQRPSVDVLTGLIKSNIPTRIAFQVSSKIDSRTILDGQGAEMLLGHGDMLYLAPGQGTPARIHGAFVSDSEVHKVAKDWKSRSEPQYIDSITDGAIEDSGTGGILSDADEADPLYDEAVEFVLDSRKASISSIQRRLKIGYNRAARLIETMETAGLVSPMEGNGAREVLVPKRE